MISVSKVVVFVVGQVIVTHSFVFRSRSPTSGKSLYFHYTSNQEVCLQSCYEENNCIYVAFNGSNNRCDLYAKGSKPIPSPQVYELFRQETDATCKTLDVASTIKFQKIQSTVSKRPNATCSDTLNASSVITYKASYYNNFRFYSEESDKIPRDYVNSSYRLTFSNGPRSACTSVPVFKKTLARRFYFGSIYNTTAYSFVGYAFADYCDIDCLGTQEIQEFKDANGSYIYDVAGKPGLTDTGLGQNFYVASVKTE